MAKKAVKAVKATKAVKSDQPKRGRPKGSKNKNPPKPKITAKQLYTLITETLQHNSQGEFDLPSMMVRYLDKSDPRSALGLHREYYIPTIEKTRFYQPDSEKAEMIFRNQASALLPALIGEGVPIREKDFKPPFCKEHK